ncbi:MAG TPA: hypothetical protein VN494_04360 [Patescibacteria group bacterium]|nr:hypothetical protein [Patescibacteria group bacterium]
MPIYEETTSCPKLAPKRYQNRFLKIRKLTTMSGEPPEFGMDLALPTSEGRWPCMSKKVAVTLVAILVALAFFTGLAFAAAKTITGEVVSVEPSEKALVINAQGKELIFRVAEKAARLVGYLFTGFLEEQEMTFNEVEKAAKAPAAELKPGDKVTVSYFEADGKLYAQSVTKD